MNVDAARARLLVHDQFILYLQGSIRRVFNCVSPRCCEQPGVARILGPPLPINDKSLPVRWRLPATSRAGRGHREFCWAVSFHGWRRRPSGSGGLCWAGSCRGNNRRSRGPSGSSAAATPLPCGRIAAHIICGAYAVAPSPTHASTTCLEFEGLLCGQPQTLLLLSLALPTACGHRNCVGIRDECRDGGEIETGRNQRTAVYARYVACANDARLPSNKNQKVRQTGMMCASQHMRTNCSKKDKQLKDGHPRLRAPIRMVMHACERATATRTHAKLRGTWHRPKLMRQCCCLR